MKRLLLIVTLLLLLGKTAAAQEEQIYKPLIFQIENKQESISYVMESYSYSITKYYKDSTGVIAPTLQMSIALEVNPDQTILEWLTIPDIIKNAKILCRKINTGEIYRTFVLKEASIVSWSESMSEYNMKISERSTIYLEVVSKEFSIDNYPLAGIKSHYEGY